MLFRSIIGIAQIQLQRANLPEEFKQAIEKIYLSGGNLLGIINDILDLSKMETGKMEINPYEYELPSLINDAVQLNILQIGTKPLEFILDLDENLPSKLIGDELRIKQILNNLLSNAIKYSREGFVKLSIYSSNRTLDNIPDSEHLNLHLIVEDSGQGMKPEDCKMLFSEYLRFNIDVNKATQGTGIGLNITKNLVEFMDGSIKAESEYGKGSKFSVVIKQKIVDCPPIGAELVEELRTFTFSRKRQDSSLRLLRESMPYGKVLIVDDFETNLYVAEGLMSPYSLQIDTAISGEIAIENIKSGKVYDVIFMDHMMPEMDGIEATKILRNMGYKGVIVALTANAISGNAEMFKNNGFDDFISKPVDIRTLDLILNTHIRDKHVTLKKKPLPKVIKPRTANDLNPEISTDLPPTETVPNIDPKLLEIFCKDTQKAVETLKESIQNKNIKSITTTTHAMKTMLAVIEEKDASLKAAELESAGINNDFGFIDKNINIFISLLEDILLRFNAENITSTEEDSTEEDQEFWQEKLTQIKMACEEYDDTKIYATLDLLKQKQWGKDKKYIIEKIHDLIFLNSDFEGAIEIVQNSLSMT